LSKGTQELANHRIVILEEVDTCAGKIMHAIFQAEMTKEKADSAIPEAFKAYTLNDISGNQMSNLDKISFRIENMCKDDWKLPAD
jgi:hypothetical protein